MLENKCSIGEKSKPKSLDVVKSYSNWRKTSKCSDEIEPRKSRNLEKSSEDIGVEIKKSGDEG